VSIKTTEGRTQVLENLLGEARSEADNLRKRVKRLEKIILSSRLIMGHEIKKPTTAISGYLDLVCDDLESASELTTLVYAQKARDECKLLEELNSFYLELLKVNSADELLGKSPIDVASLIAEAVGHLPPKLDARQRVTVNVSPDVGLVEFNPNALKLITLNLIENALVYSQKNSPVRVEVERQIEKRAMKGGRILKIRVKDDGVGIPEEYLKKIFSPFIRLREDIAEGSGLGLTLVRSLVELNGGEVYVRGARGEGTTVHLTIPIDEETENEPPVLL
jgi:signal transduction histidine kinase